MLHFLPPPVRGAVAISLYIVNTICCFTLMTPFIFLKVIIPHAATRNRLTIVLMKLGMGWVSINSLIMRLTQNIKWDVKGIEGFSTRESYLVFSNHQSWADILVLQHLFKYRIPFLKFFLKRELIKVPLLGVAWWALDFPFMKRYSRDFLEKHPELKGKDIETTRKYCEKFKTSPISVINFLEGTRFEPAKHDKQGSPFSHLLLPRAGGVAIVLSSMGACLSGIIDVTIAYPQNQPPISFWHFLKGKVPAIVVRVKTYPVPPEFIGRSYEEDEHFKTAFQKWINQVWEEKDRQIDQLLRAA